MGIVKTSNDNTLSVQVITPTINGKSQHKEVCLLIESMEDDRIITMTVAQAYKLIKALNSTIRDIEAL